MNNLKLYRKKAQKTQKEIADYLGIVQQAYNHYETGRRNIPIENAIKLADLYNVSVDVLLGRTEAKLDNIQIKPEIVAEDDVFIPLVASLRCGYGENGQALDIIKKIPVPASYIRRWGNNLKCVLAMGDSMSPTIISGDMMLCRPSDAWGDGNIVIVNVNDSDTVKRIYRAKDGGIDLKPDNPAYETMHYSPADIERYQVHVLGRVMMTLSKEL